MNLLDLMVKVSVDDQASARIGGIGNSIKGTLGTAARAGAAALAAGIASATASVVAFGKTALDSYAQYEQLEGGIDKLFGTGGKNLEEYAASVGQTVEQASGKFDALNQAHDLVMQNAQRAFETAGMSANQYMEQASGFSAALTNALGGDTVKAAEQVDVAMRAMSDNVNTFGSNMGSVQDAFQGFAKQNYTMLDNLKLGYGGTKQEMERLIADANEWGAANGKASDLSIESFSDVITAIQQIQEKQQIAGTTAREASQTIEGSINSTKAAWANLLTELGKDDGDIGARITELAESAGNVVSNVVPRIAQIGDGLAEALPLIVPKALELGGQIASSIGSGLMQAVPNLLMSLTEAVPSMLAGLTETFMGLTMQIGNMLVANGPLLMESATMFFQNILTAFTTNLPMIVEGFVSGILGLVDLLIQNGPSLLVAAGQFILNIATAILTNLPTIISTLASGITQLVTGVISRAPEMLAAGMELIGGLVQAIASKGPEILSGIQQTVQAGVDAVAGFVGAMLDAGANLIQGLIDGIAGGIGGVVDTIVGGVQGAIETAKAMLGIASPSKVFEGIGGFTMEGFAIGIEADATKAVKAMEDASNAVYGAASGSVSLGLSATPSGAYSGSEGVSVVIENFVNNTREDARSLATRIGEYTDMELKMRGIRKSTAGGLAV